MHESPYLKEQYLTEPEFMAEVGATNLSKLYRIRIRTKITPQKMLVNNQNQKMYAVRDIIEARRKGLLK